MAHKTGFTRQSLSDLLSETGFVEVRLRRGGSLTCGRAPISHEPVRRQSVVNYLFIHQNFPGQYVHVARLSGGSRASRCLHHPAAERPDRRACARSSIRQPRARPRCHPYLARIRRQPSPTASRSPAVCEALKRDGFTPDLVVGHNGWGEILYVKDSGRRCHCSAISNSSIAPSGSRSSISIPNSRRARRRDAIANAQRDQPAGARCRRLGPDADRMAAQPYPERYWRRISVIHEGIDTRLVRPEREPAFGSTAGCRCRVDDEMITYSARNLEPYRGFHIFMRALPKVLRRRPTAHVLIVGGDGVSYGRSPARRAGAGAKSCWPNSTGQLDLSRIHFLGRLPYQQYLAMLQISTVHVYLTYPFVLSWSLLEAMAAGCLVIGSRTPPVEEVVSDGDNGCLVDFFDVDGLADKHRPRLRRACPATNRCAERRAPQCCAATTSRPSVFLGTSSCSTS